MAKPAQLVSIDNRIQEIERLLRKNKKGISSLRAEIREMADKFKHINLTKRGRYADFEVAADPRFPHVLSNIWRNGWEADDWEK
jgi:hypothetical protein